LPCGSRSPAFIQRAASNERESLLPKVIRELVILTVGTARDSDYELYVHIVEARSAGLSEKLINGVRRGSTKELNREQLAAYTFTRELIHRHRVSDETYAAVLRAYGFYGVIDMVHLIGMYLTASALLNAFEVPASPIPPAVAR
jgi:4-carboxymuconolactone decarboxylase